MPSASEPLVTAAATGSSDGSASLDLDKAPGLAEAIDWVSALCALGLTAVTGSAVAPTLVALDEDRRRPGHRRGRAAGRRAGRDRDRHRRGSTAPRSRSTWPNGCGRRGSPRRSPARRGSPRPSRRSRRRHGLGSTGQHGSRCSSGTPTWPSSTRCSTRCSAAYAHRGRRRGPMGPPPRGRRRSSPARRPGRRAGGRRRAPVGDPPVRARHGGDEPMTASPCPSCRPSSRTGPADVPFDQLDPAELARLGR